MDGEFDLEKRKKAIWIIHIAFMNSCLAYLLIDLFVIPASVEVARDAFVINVLLSIAAIMAPLGFIVPGWIGGIRPGDPAQTGNRWRLLQMRSIVANSFFEAPAAFGVVGHFVGMGVLLRSGLIGFAFILLIVQGARLKGWIEEFESESSGLRR